MTDRPLPQNTDLERNLLGIIIARNETLFEVSHIVTKADFHEPWHIELFSLLRDMIEAGRDATPSTLLHDMSQDSDIGGISAAEYLRLISADVPDYSMAPTFARTIRDLAMRRRLIAVANKHLDEAYSAPATITAVEIEARYHAQASSLFGSIQEAGMQPLGDLGMSVLKKTQTALQGDRRLGLGSGLKAWDDLCGAFLPGRMVCLSGPSGSGKTALAMQIAKKIAEEEPVLVQSIEMDGEELATRDFTGLTGIAGERIERADLDVDEFSRLVDAQAEQKKSKLIINSAKSPTVGSIRGQAMRLKRMYGLKLLVIDHLRYIKPSEKSRDIFEQQSNDMQALNALADDLGIAVLLLCQLKASFGSEPKLRDPNVGDIFNGAVIEQESDVLVIVHRDEFMLARRKPTELSQQSQWEVDMANAKGKAKLILNKRRGGHGYGTRIVGFNGPTQRFSDEIPKVDFFGVSARELA